ncbi:S1 family serine peptidase [Amycolatopsis umgeniensis]|uniref:Secreted trypsin-like serine protease n=1 Tax=Amycolatopsis umgeniensis TaxID=336628 RepID=A0A841AYU1_9PSEU|nr:serine protease [Amycolatopsis umgeniensis]MBB5852107.1 secreted trypsin-like serine protease [Amycolatopsis umgeniensis]
MRHFLIAAIAVLLTLSMAPAASAEEDIQGGTPYDIKLVPWTLSLQTANGTPFCGAVLVDLDIALTAAHCMRNRIPATLRVSAGDSDRTKGDRVAVSSALSHPQNNAESRDFDVAVLRLERKLRPNPRIKVARIADTDRRTGTMLTVVGWGIKHHGGGTPKHLLGIQVPTVDRVDVCQPAYKTKLTERMLCAGTADGHLDTCKGDSGGPATDSHRLLVGLVSFGYRCLYPTKNGSYTVFANLAEPELRAWIRANANGK